MRKDDQTHKIIKSSEQIRYVLTENKSALPYIPKLLTNKGFYYHYDVELTMAYFNGEIYTFITLAVSKLIKHEIALWQSLRFIG